jgi:hypothetical protein
MTIFRWACAMACALLTLLAFSAPALAQVSGSIKAQAPAGFLPGQASFCSTDGGTTWSPCSGGGGGAVTAQGTDGSTPRTLRTDGRGGLVPAQGVVASTRTTLTASTATPIEAAAATGRLLQSIAIETAISAPIFICTTQTTSCSPTSYDFLIPSGSGAGTIFTAPFATTGRLYAYSTAAPAVVLNSWTAAP